MRMRLGFSTYIQIKHFDIVTFDNPIYVNAKVFRLSPGTQKTLRPFRVSAIKPAMDAERFCLQTLL